MNLKAYKFRIEPTPDQIVLFNKTFGSTCPFCGSVHDRDLNAAKNILRKGYEDLTGVQVEFGDFPKSSSAESVDYSRGEAVSLFDEHHHLASSVKRLENQLNFL